MKYKRIKILILLVTIFLILAGISILVITNNNKVFTQMKQAKEENGITITYKLDSYINNKFKILITIEDKENGINTVQLPDNTIFCYGKEIVGIDYEVEEGKDYVVVITNAKGDEKREIINFTKPIDPIIPSIDTGYLTLTSTGVKKPEAIEIKYDERPEFENYYSTNYGKTWNIYEGPISSFYIKAKSVHKKFDGIYAMSERKIESPLDALGIKSCDGDIETYEEGWIDSTLPAKIIHLDETTYGKNIKIDYALFTGWHRTFIMTFYNSEGVALKQVSAPEPEKEVLVQYNTIVPEGSSYILFDSTRDIYSGIRIYELTIE